MIIYSVSCCFFFIFASCANTAILDISGNASCDLSGNEYFTSFACAFEPPLNDAFDPHDSDVSSNYVLTAESLSKLEGDIPHNLRFTSTNVLSLLHIKSKSCATAQCKQEESDATSSTVKWKGPGNGFLSKNSSFVALFVPEVIQEAPTESNSTSGTSPSRIPQSMELVFKNAEVTAKIFDFLDLKGVRLLSSTCSQVQNLIKSHVKAEFRSLFPCLDGISDDVLFLKEFTVALKFLNVTDSGFFMSGMSPFMNVMYLIHSKASSDRSFKERFALVNLIELLRGSGVFESSALDMDFTVLFSKLPRPLYVFFPHDISNDMNIFQTEFVSIVMKCARYGNVRILRALIEDLFIILPRPLLGSFILENVLLCREKGRDGDRTSSWTPLHRSVLASSTKMASYLFSTLTGLEPVLEAYAKTLADKNIANSEPLNVSYLEKVFFPHLAKLKLKRHLQKHILNLNFGPKDVKLVFMAIMKSTCPDVLKFFIYLENQFNGPITEKKFKLYLNLAFASKSVSNLRIILNFTDISLSAAESLIPFDFAIRYDWPLGLVESVRLWGLDLSKARIDGFNNIFHLVGRYGSIQILKYLKSKLDEPTVKKLINDMNASGQYPLELALDQGHWNLFTTFHELGAIIWPRNYHSILQFQASLLNYSFSNDQYKLEEFALQSNLTNTRVSNLEWAIISKNTQALQWFLSFLPVSALRLFDGAGQAPVHIAVIVGNCDALRLLLRLHPELVNVRNRFNETPLKLAQNIQRKTNEIQIIDEIISILNFCDKE